jgi:RNA polymerase sigma-70 factor (ECF subfamily)
LAGSAISEATLRSLVDAARKGNVGAADRLVRETWEATYTLAFRLTGNEQDALDVAQEAYLRAMRALPRFRGEARFSTWLYRVTANCANDNLSERRRSFVRLDRAGERLGELDQLADHRPEHDPEASASAIDERAALSEALLRLPWKLRQVVVLRDIYDLPHKAIASELGTSEAATKVRLQRARKRLREDLARFWQAEEAGLIRGPKGRASKLERVAGAKVGRRRVAGADDDAMAS